MPTKTMGQLLTANYAGLSEKEKELLNSGYLTEDTYTYTAPAADNSGSLVSVDADTKTVTAAQYTSGGQTWTPTGAQVMVNGVSVEDVTLTDSGSSSYTGTFAYTDTSYSIAVTYAMSITATLAAQQKLLDAAGNLLGAADAVKNAVDGADGLETLLKTEVQFSTAYMVDNLNNTNLSTHTVAEVVAALNPKDGGGIPNSSIAPENKTSLVLSDAEGLLLKQITDDIKDDGTLSLVTLLAGYYGEGKVKNVAALCLSANSTALQSAVKDAYDQTALLQKMSALQFFSASLWNLVSSSLNGIMTSLTPCKDYDWSKLTGLAKSGLTTVESSALDTLVGGFAAADVTASTATMTALPADTTVVTASVAQGTINVVVEASVYGEDATTVTPLSQNAGTARMAALTSEADVKAAIDADATMEAAVVSGWNVPTGTFSYNVGTTYYNREVTITPAIPATGLADGVTYTYTVRYTPKTYQVTATGCDDITDGMYDYGYSLTLPALVSADKVYDYTVNGEAHDQGESIRVVGITNITRREGKAWEKHNVGEMIASNYAPIDTVAQGILASAALSTGSVRLRTPADAAALLSIAPDGGSYVVTAKTYNANTTGLRWIPQTAICMKNGVAVGSAAAFAPSGSDYAVTVTGDFDSVSVLYELQLGWTDIAADFDAAKATTILNLPKTLADDATRQLSAMTSLNNQYGTLGQVGGKMSTVKVMINGIDVNDPTQVAADDVQRTLDAKAAMNVLFATCYDSGNAEVEKRQLFLYNYLTEYRTKATDGEKLAYYFKNWDTIHAQTQTVYDNLVIILAAESVRNLIQANAETAEYYDKLNDITTKFGNLLGNMVAPNVFINKTSTQLTTLSAAVVKASKEGTASAYGAIDAMETPVLKANLSVDAPDKLTVTIEAVVKSSDGEIIGRNSRSETFDVDSGSTARVLQAADIAKLNTALDTAKSAANLDAAHYALTADSSAMLSAGDTLDATKTLTFTYTPKTYTVKYTQNGAASGVSDVTFPFDDREVALPASSEAGYRYDYTVNGAVVNAATYTFSAAEIDTLFVGGIYTIDRTRVDIARENVLKMVSRLNQDVANRGFTYTEAATGRECLKISFVPMEKAGQMSVVMRVSPTGITQDMATKLLADMVTELMTFNNVVVDGETFYDGDKIHLQSLVDMLLGSGFGMETVLNAIDANGNINEMTELAGGVCPTANAENVIVVGTKYASQLDQLGAKLLQTGLTLDGSVVQLYVTLEDFDQSAADLQNARDKVNTLYGNVNVTLKDGAVKVDATAPDRGYQLFIAALLALGETDLSDVSSFDLSVVEPRVYELIKPVLMDTAVTGTTIKNTLTKFGVSRDISEYADMYDKYIGSIRKVLDATTLLNKTGDAENFNADVSYDVSSLVNGLSGDLGNVLSGIIAESELNGQLKTEVRGATAVGDYEAMIVTTAGPKFVKNLAGYTVDQSNALVVVLKNIGSGTLRVTGDNVVIDLNNKTLACNIACSGSRNMIVDSTMATAESGTVSGTVSGATITAGHYTRDVSAMLKSGYSLNGGLVSNDYYTIETIGSTVRVTIKAMMDTLKDVDRNDLAAVAAELVSDIALTYYGTAQSLSVGGNAIYALTVDDASKVFENGAFKVNGSYANELIDDTIDYAGATALINDLLAKLTDFDTLANAVGAGVPAITYSLATTAWDVTLARSASGDYLQPGVTGKTGSTENHTLEIYVNSDSAADNESLKSALLEVNNLTKTLNVNVALNDVSLNSKTLEGTMSGSGELYVDMSEDPSYAVVTALMAAKKLPAGALRDELVSAIDQYYELNNMASLKTAMEKLTAAQVIAGLKSVTTATSFTGIAANLGLGSTALAALNTANVDTNMKNYRNAMVLMGRVLGRLGIVGNASTLNGRDTGVNGVYGAYVFSQTNVTKSASRTVRAPWAVKANVNLTAVDVTLKLFNEDSDIIVKDSANGKYIYNGTDLTTAFVKANSIDASTVVFHSNNHVLAGDQEISKNVTIEVETGASFGLGGYKFILTDKDAAVTMTGIALENVGKTASLAGYYLVKTGSKVSLAHYAVGVMPVSGEETFYDAIPAITGNCTLKIYGDVVLTSNVELAHLVTISNNGGSLSGTTGKFVLKAGGELYNGFASGSDPWAFLVITDTLDSYVNIVGNRASRVEYPAKVNDTYYKTWTEVAAHLNDNAANTLDVFADVPAGTVLPVSKSLTVSVASGVTFSGEFNLSDENATVQATGLTLTTSNVKSGVTGYAVSIDTAANKARLKTTRVLVTYDGRQEGYETFEAALAAANGKNCVIDVQKAVTLTENASINAYVTVTGADKINCNGKVFNVTKLGVLVADLGTLNKGTDVNVVDLGGTQWRYYNNTVDMTNSTAGTFAVYEANTDAYYTTIQDAMSAAETAGKAAVITVVAPLTLAAGTKIDVSGNVTISRRYNMTIGSGAAFRLTKVAARLTLEGAIVNVETNVSDYRVVNSISGGSYVYYLTPIGGGGGGGSTIPTTPTSHVSGSYIYLDVKPGGITASQLQTILRKVLSSSGAAVTVNSGLTSAGLVANGATVSVSNSSYDGAYTIIIMGDTNCNGKTDAGDAVKMRNHYFGTATLTGVSLMAADMNLNGKVDAGDAVKNRVKYQKWSSYQSTLKVTG